MARKDLTMGLLDKLSGKKSEPKPQQQQTSSNDPFERIGGADPSNQGVYPLPGVYPFLYVDSLKMIKSRKGDDLFIAELEILESLVEARPAGTRMSWIVNMRHDPSPGNVKAFMVALTRIESDGIDADSMKLAVSEKNPCHGLLIRLEATATETKSGGPFTLCKWQSVPSDVQNKAEELRKLAGFDTPF